MTQGTVKFFNAAKGFGFITPDDGGKDVFVPAASITASGVAGLKPGQRVSFDVAPDAKGPKAVELKLIAPEPSPPKPAKKAEPSAAPMQARAELVMYLDPASDLARDALDELQDAGFAPRLVDYVANPPSKEALKTLSLLLRDSDQSLVRKYDPLFLELRLDDRFISDSEYWAAIHEHPILINGPVLTMAAKASVCRSEAAVKAFMASITGGTAPVPVKPKGMPERLSGLVKATAMAPAEPDLQVVEAEPMVEKPQKKARPLAEKAVKKKPEPKAKAKPKETAKGTAQEKKPAKAKKAVPKAAKKAR